MDSLLLLWEKVGVTVVRVTAAGDGQHAFPSWGFVPDSGRSRDSGLLPLRLALPRDARARRSLSARP